jgi:uncharacterized protein (DUF952 family)
MASANTDITRMIFKICASAAWEAACRTGAFAGAPIDLADGYIHLSAADQVRETAGKWFAGQDGLLLVGFDPDELGPELRWEPSRGGALFPHLYAPLPTAAARLTVPLAPGPDGAFVFPEGVP